jgi:hypothetical protein
MIAMAAISFILSPATGGNDLHDMHDLQNGRALMPHIACRAGHAGQFPTLSGWVRVSLVPNPDGMLAASTVERQDDPHLPQRRLRPL